MPPRGGLNSHRLSSLNQRQDRVQVPYMADLPNLVKMEF